MYEIIESLSRQMGARIDFQESVSSTNDVIKEGGYAHGDCVIADVQTNGRGQRGNGWESEAGKNLTFSVRFDPSFLPADRQFLLSESVALAVADTLVYFGLEPSVKWTNDIYIGDDKVAGILIENDIMGGTLFRSIVGIGLNVNQSVFESDAPNPVSMRMAAGREFDRGEVFGKLYSALLGRYDQLCEGLVQTIEEDYHDRLYLLGEEHEFRLPDGSRFVGVIRRVEPTGELMVEHPDGSIKGYLFKEIFFR